MLSKNIRQSAKEEIALSKNELRQLVFWAKIGLRERNGIQPTGSYYPEVLSTISDLETGIGKVLI